nr:MAG TPA: replication initiator protein [Caudoviricetes sp.]
MKQYYSSENFSNSHTLPLLEELVTGREWNTKISYEEVILYTLFRYRMNLSVANHRKFEDEKGLYIFYRQDELAKELNKPLRTIQLWFSKLREHGLIYTEPQGLGKPQKIYLLNVTTSSSPDATDCGPYSQQIASGYATDCESDSQRTASPYIEKKYIRSNTEKKYINNRETQRKAPHISKKEEIQNLIHEFAGENNELTESLEAWVEQRAGEKNFTPRSVKMNLKKLYDLSNGNVQDMIEIVNQTVMNGWKSFFPVRDKERFGKRGSGGSTKIADEMEKAQKMIDEIERRKHEQNTTGFNNNDWIL